MAIPSSITDPNRVITGEKAKTSYENSQRAKTIGKQTTDRGTLITKSNQEMGKNSFLKVLVAEMSHMDPTQNQDSTAMVTQMAQLSSMEQMSNLNETMTTSAYQGLIGKGVTVSETDSKGNPYTGIVKGVSKENGSYYLSLLINQNGKDTWKVVDATTLTSVLENNYDNSRMALNSNFTAASSLANDKTNKAVIVTDDGKGNNVIVKGTVKSAFIDNGVVKVRVAAFDSDNKESATTTDYPYSSILKAGDLTDKDMDVKVEDLSDSKDDTIDPRLDPNNTASFDLKYYYDHLNSSKTPVKGSSDKYINDESAQKEADALKKTNG